MRGATSPLWMHVLWTTTQAKLMTFTVSFKLWCLLFATWNLLFSLSKGPSANYLTWLLRYLNNFRSHLRQHRRTVFRAMFKKDMHHHLKSLWQKKTLNILKLFWNESPFDTHFNHCLCTTIFSFCEIHITFNYWLVNFFGRTYNCWFKQFNHFNNNLDIITTPEFVQCNRQSFYWWCKCIYPVLCFIILKRILFKIILNVSLETRKASLIHSSL